MKSWRVNINCLYEEAESQPSNAPLDWRLLRPVKNAGLAMTKTIKERKE
jgi:hypothetical protein